MKGLLTFYLLITILILGCTDYNKSSNRTIVARTGDKYLYLDQIPPISTVSLSPEDSISIVRNYIDRWIKKELMLSKAESNVSEEYQAEINMKLEETRANLMIYQYEQQMMIQKMDTLVSASEINRYFEENTSTFNLTAPIVKAIFIKIPAEAPNIDRVRQWYRSSSQSDLQSLESYCYQFAEKFDDFGEKWINYNYLLRELPSDPGNPDRFLRNNNYYEASDPSYFYFVNFRDHRLQETEAPVEYVQDDIRNIILNNRKIEFLKSLENGIYNEAMRENAFRIF